MAITEQDETRIYTEQEINQVVEKIDNMHLGSRNEGELLFRCKWVIRQLQESLGPCKCGNIINHAYCDRCLRQWES